MKNVFLKGMTYGWGSKRGEYRTEYAEDSMRKLAETGSEWIALSFGHGKTLCIQQKFIMITVTR